MKNIKNKNAFTLIELLVVVSILSILSAISFISLQGYSYKARDSIRSIDLSNISKTLNVYEINSGKYPLPSNYSNINYLGNVVWRQGTFGDSVYDITGFLNKKPVDPKTFVEYSYSVTSTQTEFLLGGITEGDTLSLEIGKGVFTKTNASDVDIKAFVIGNYNGQVLKNIEGNKCELLAIPTIISNGGTNSELQDILDNSQLVYNGYKNLPNSFSSTDLNLNGGFDFKPNKLLIYNDNDGCKDLRIEKNTYTRINLIKDIQESYSGTIISNEELIKKTLELDINLHTPSKDVIDYANNLVSEVFGGTKNK